jgi:hypothetical protein
MTRQLGPEPYPFLLNSFSFEFFRIMLNDRDDLSIVVSANALTPAALAFNLSITRR